VNPLFSKPLAIEFRAGHNSGGNVWSFMARFIYFDYQGEFPSAITFPDPPTDYRYIVEISKNDSDGCIRTKIDLKNMAKHLLLGCFDQVKAAIILSDSAQFEIAQEKFKKVEKSQIHSGRDGAVYKIIRDPRL
jgi:hypothetical protein